MASRGFSLGEIRVFLHNPISNFSKNVDVSLSWRLIIVKSGVGGPLSRPRISSGPDENGRQEKSGG